MIFALFLGGFVIFSTLNIRGDENLPNIISNVFERNNIIPTGTLKGNIGDPILDEPKEPPQKEIITYTPSTENHCIGNTCTQTIYSSVRFADDKGTPIENATSLKNSAFHVEYIEEDKLHDFEVVDFNYTSITLKPILLDAKEVGKDILISVLNYNTTKVDESRNASKDLTDYKNTYSATTTSVVNFKSMDDKKEITFSDNYTILNKMFKIGENSTTITISGTGGVLEDIDGEDTGGDDIIFIKFNISSIPASIQINSANMSLYVDSKTNSGVDTDSSVGYIPNQTWREVPTDSQFTNLFGSITNTTTPTINATPEADIWIKLLVTQQVSAAYNDSSKNCTISLGDPDNPFGTLSADSIYDNGWFIIGDSTNYVKLEDRENDNGNAGKGPQLIVTYTAFDTQPPTYDLNQTNSTVAGTNVNHSLYWEDTSNGESAAGLSGYIFSFCNGTYTNTTTYNYGTNLVSPTANTILKNGGLSNPQLAYDGNHATQGEANRSTTMALANSTLYTTFTNLNIPAGAIIDGIQVQAEASRVGTATSTFFFEVNNGTHYSNTKTNLVIPSTTVTNYTNGSTSNLWGLVWTSTTANNISVNVSGYGSSATTKRQLLQELYVNITYHITNSTYPTCDSANAILTNGTWTAFPTTGVTQWSNVSKLVNSTVGSTIRWCYYANDTSNNWNGTSCVNPFSYLTTTSGVTPDATFSIGMPSTYSLSAITGTTEGTATFTTSNISCNFTDSSENWIQPNATGGTNGQNGILYPIFYIDNTGTGNENYTMKLDSALPYGINITANSSCTGGGECISTPINLSTSYQRIAGAVPNTAFVNVTLWCGVSRQTSSGQSNGITIYLNGSLT